MKLLYTTFFLWACISFAAICQNFKLTDPIPVDKDVRIGKLANGLTYYIRKNSHPENRVELRLAVNAGSILEDEDQQGLAHFTEHMSFNGTKNFKKNELISYLQSVGVKFGGDLNAYTSFDETVYRLLLPIDKPEVVEKGFQVIEDWAHNVSFDSTEIENERGVITEEWRIGRGASQRLQSQYFPVLFNQSQYAQRLPIGKIEVIQNFSQSAIKRFYNDWYRPDLLAVVVVGDIDVDQYEKKIKEHFAGIPSRLNERPRKIYDVPDNTKPLISISTDKEANQTQVMVYFKTNHKPDNTMADYKEFIIEQLYFHMFSQRLGELVGTENPPYILGHASLQNLARSKDAFALSARVSETGIEQGLKTLLEETERVKRFGFTETELERARKSILNKYSNAFNEREKSESAGYADELVRNFLKGEAIPGITNEYQFAKQTIPEISLEEVNNFDNEVLTNFNQVVIITAPEKAKAALPSESKVLATFEEVSKETIKPYTDKVTDKVLIAKKPVAGKIIKEESIKEINATRLTLSNGATVILKPTDFKNDEILVSSYSRGGNYLYDDKDYFSASYASSYIQESGIGNFSKTALQKTLAGTNAMVSPFINSISEGIKGKAAPKDLETWFQLINLYYTQPHADSVAFRSLIKRNKAFLKTLTANPKTYYEDQLSRILSNNSIRGGGVPEEKDLDKVDPQRALDIYRERFGNAGDFTFFFIGSFDVKSLEPFIETYIASLPSTGKKENYKDLGIRPPKGSVDKKIYKGSDPKSIVTITFSGLNKYNASDDYKLKILTDVLNIKLMESLREQKGGVYGVRVGARLSKFPYENFLSQINFQCAPGNADSLTVAALNEIHKIQNNGVSEKDLSKVKETKKREFEVNLKNNLFWLNALEKSYTYGEDFKNILTKNQELEKINSEDIQITARKYFNKDYIKVVLYPENNK